MQYTNNIPTTTVTINQKKYLYFSGTSYLGIQSHPDFKKSIEKAQKKWGIGSYGSSRSANLQLDVYNKAEQFLAETLKTEASVTVSSGTLASLFASKILHEKGYPFFHFPRTHSSLLTYPSEPFFMGDAIHPKVKENDTIVVLADAIASLETALTDFSILEGLSKDCEVILLLDISHSLGLFSVDDYKIPTSIQTVLVGSLGKGYGINGGLIAGNSSLIKNIKEESLFVGSAGMSPSQLQVFLDVQEVYINQKEKLLSLCSYFYEQTAGLPFIRGAKNYPVSFIDNEDFYEFLHSHQILITSFFYPAAQKNMQRIVLNANHTKDQVDELIKVLNFLNELI